MKSSNNSCMSEEGASSFTCGFTRYFYQSQGMTGVAVA